MTSEHDEENALAAGMASGDESALARLVDRTGPRIFALALRIVGNARDAEEVVQDTFVTAWRNAAQYDARRAAAFTWLVAIARNKAIDRLRSLRRRIPPPPSTGNGIVREPAVTRTAADDAATGDRAALVAETVRALPPNQRQAVELAFFEGLSHPEIAARLGESIGTVKSRIRLGMEKLRSRLGRTVQ